MYEFSLYSIPPFLTAVFLFILGLFVLFGGAGIFINSYAGLYNTETFLWGGYAMPPILEKAPEYIFDWKYPQFLATHQSNCDKNYDYVTKLLQEGSLVIGSYALGEEIEYLLANHKDFTKYGYKARPSFILNQPDNQPIATGNDNQSGEIEGRATKAAFIGWGYPETEWVWSQCKTAMIIIGETNFDTQGSKYKMQISSSSNGEQLVQVRLNGDTIGSIYFDGSESTEQLSFDGSLLNRNELNWLEFEISNTESPGNGEIRELGLAFYSLKITGIE